MPRSARFKLPAIEDLLRQLEYAPAETRRRQMDAAERLIADIDPDQQYPRDFIVYRITNYRPDSADAPVTFPGRVLLPDLVNFVQALSRDLGLSAEELERVAVPVKELPARLNVSSKTIQRYRKQGLVCHFVRCGDGELRLMCFEDALKRFEQLRAAQLRKAAGFTRINVEQEAAIIEQARELRRTRRLSLNQAALELARRHGRAHETLRMMLRRHDRKTAEPIFRDRGPLRERDIRVIHRAWRWGIAPGTLASRFGKTKPTIHRAINRRRAELLRQIDVRYVALPTFDLPDAASVILAAPAVVRDLADLPPTHDALELIAAIQAAAPLAEDAEDAMLAAYNFLKMRAKSGIASLGDWPGSEELDAIETDLRWASMLKRKLTAAGLPAAMRRIEQNLHRPLRSELAEQIVSLLELAVAVCAATVESHDPMRANRLERVTAFAMDRALAKRDEARAPARAAARHQAGSIRLPGLLDALSAWDGWLGLRRDCVKHVASLPEKARLAVTLRYGLDGTPPQTIADLARHTESTPVGVVRLLARAERLLRAAARSSAA